MFLFGRCSLSRTVIVLAIIIMRSKEHGFSQAANITTPLSDAGDHRCSSSESHDPALCPRLRKRELKGNYAALAALSMNNAKTLGRAMRQMEAIGNVFADYAVVIVENDSTDGTRSLLLDWKTRNSRVIVESADFHRIKRPSISFLAHLRNRALEVIYHRFYGTSLNEAARKIDMLIILDVDLVAVDLQGFKEAASAILGEGVPNPVVGATANGVQRDGRYYDTFAFRSCHWHWNASAGVMYRRVPHSYWEKLMPLYPSDLAPFPVRSAFSGVAVYSARDVFGPLPVDAFPSWRGHEGAVAARNSSDSPIGTVYRHLEELGRKDKLPCAYGDGGVGECEHVAFHACLNARASSRLKAPLHLFPKFGVQYSFGRTFQLDDKPTEFVLPGWKPRFNDLSVPQPQSYPGQPAFWKTPADMKFPDSGLNTIHLK